MSNNQAKRTNKAISTDQQGRVTHYGGIFIGIVKDTSDARTMGRLRVWVPEFKTVETDETGWIIVNYCSPFAGATPLADIGEDITDSDQSQSSYGMWFTPPDVDNMVFIFFVNSDSAQGYWFGCGFQQNMNHMIPGIAASTNNYATARGMPQKYKDIPLPLSEYNKKTRSSISGGITRPVAKSAYVSIARQGLIRDRIRGTNKASVKNTSEVYGILTPGPKNPNSSSGRLGGNRLILDDTEGQEAIVLKTRSGAQVRLDETNGLIYFINKRGTGWIQIDDDGNMDFFAAKNIAFRAMEDFVIRADRDVIFEAGRNINMKARNDYLDGTGGFDTSDTLKFGGNIKLQATNTLQASSLNAMMFDCTSGNINVKAKADVKIKSEGSLYVETIGNGNIKATGKLSLSSGTDLSLLGTNITNSASSIFGVSAGASTEIVGGTTMNISCGIYNVNNAVASPPSATDATSAEPNSAIVPETYEKINVNESFTDDWMMDRTSSKVTTIASRLPTFEPCPEHKLR